MQVQFVFLLIRSISHFHCRPRLALHDLLLFFCLHVFLTRSSLLALAKSIYYAYLLQWTREPPLSSTALSWSNVLEHYLSTELILVRFRSIRGINKGESVLQYYKSLTYSQIRK